MDLIRDCLDKKLVDRNGRSMGRVDGIILVLEPGRQTRVAYIESGVKTVADRIGPRVGKLVARISKRVGEDRFRIPWGKLRVGVNQVRANVEAESTPALAFELWLRKKIIGRIPGA
jgi:sporulation protein YlmC with PRC-barrel domain